MLYHDGGLFLFLPVFKLHRKAKASLFYSIILIDREHDNGRLSCVHSLLECSFSLDSTLEGKVQDSNFFNCMHFKFFVGFGSWSPTLPVHLTRTLSSCDAMILYLAPPPMPILIMIFLIWTRHESQNESLS